jgi:predicted DsbA family dithiol-disulfide isomerase
MTKVFSVLSLLFSTALILCAADNDAGRVASGDTLLVEIDGVKLTLADFEGKRPAGLFQARNNFFEAERKAVDDFVNEYLLKREAEKEGLTTDALLERHVNAGGFKQPSEETLRVYYEGVDTTETYEAVRDKIIEAIRTRRLAKARTAYLQSLRNQAKISFLLAPPRAPISMKDTPVRGSAKAPVMIVEFADYECPYCQQIQPVVDKLLADYQGKVALAFKDLPLPSHAHAQKAGEAAHCAQVQGKYWEFHDLLFSARQFEIPELKDTAKKLKLDVDSFSKCLDSGAQAETVKTQFDESQVLGLPGTPVFFVNGRMINPNGTVSYDTLRQLVEEELAAQPGKASASPAGGDQR